MPSQIIDLTNLAAADGFVVQGDLPGDNSGLSVAAAGDVNGDGIDDVIVSALRSDDGGGDAGEAFVIYGRIGATRGTLDLSTLAAADGFTIQGDRALDQAGVSVSGAGDVNGDGINDLIVGANGGDNGGAEAGEAYVVYGQAGATRGRVDLTFLAASDGFIIQGDVAGDQAGVSVSGAGDVNGDGIDDVIVGAIGGDDGGLGAGEAYVIYGRTGSRPTLDLTNLSAADGFIIQGDADGDQAGVSVSGAGDVNGDGIDDVIVGAGFGDDGGANAGEAYVIYGRTGATRGTIDLATLTASDGFIIQGDTDGDLAGRSVSKAGDVNGDGIDDLIIGAASGDDGDNSAGEAYVIYGKAGATRGTVDLTGLAATDGFVIQGDSFGDQAGFAVGAAGDVNGDGIDDLIVGANGEDNGGNNSGEAYVIFGRAGTTRGRLDLTGLQSTDGLIIRGDTAGDQVGSSVSAAGDINGDGIDDIIVGAVGGDDGGGDAGEAYIIYGNRDFGAILGTAAGETLTGTAGNDVILAREGNDTMNGGDGNDRLDGGAGDDAMAGGTGDDIYVVDSAGDSVTELANEGSDLVRTAILAYTLTANVENLTFTGTGAFSGRGNSIANAITGGSDANRLIGKAGDDVLTGGDGDDILSGDDGADTLNGGNGNDTLIVSDTLDTLSGGAGIDTALIVAPLTLTLVADVEWAENQSGGAVDVTMNALDNLYGGGAGTDVVAGGDGNDVLLGYGGTDTLNGDDGDDRIDSGADNDILSGGTGNDVLESGTGNDSLDGGDGDDTLFAGEDDDRLTGGAGIDFLFGGLGADTFVFANGDAAASFDTDRIFDFDTGSDDRIDLSAIDAISGDGDDAFTFIDDAAFSNTAGELRTEVFGFDTYVMGDIDGDGIADFIIRVDGSAPLSASDFLL